MFDKAIIQTDRFMDLSMSSKALYFLLGMEADDEGFVSYKMVMRIHGGNEDDIKVLVAKGFLIMFDSGVVVVTDWHTNNYLNKTRIKPTRYQAEKIQLSLIPIDNTDGFTNDKKYVFNICSTRREENRIEEKRREENIHTEKVKKVDEVPLIIKAFEDIDPKNKTYYGHKGQRSACTFLIKEYGLDSTLEAVDFIKGIYSKEVLPEYFPSINSPYELKEKWTKVQQFVKRLQTQKIKETNSMIW